MRIVYATTVPLNEHTAPAHHVLASSEALRQLGHTVDMMYEGPRLDQAIATRAFDRETVLVRPRLRGGARLMHVHLALELMRRDWSDVDVLYLRAAPTRSLLWALDGVPVPKVLEINGSDIFHFELFPAFARAMDLILVDSEPLRRKCIESGGVPATKVAVHLSPAIDPSDTQLRDRDEARRELGIELERPVVVHISGFQPQHDFPTIERAIRALICEADAEATQWVLVGSGPAFTAVREHLADTIDTGVVVMPGQVSIEQAMTYIAAADVCINVFTSARLADGNLRAFKLYQYVGSARPTVEAVVEDLPVEEWARDSLYLIPPESPAELAHAVSDILRDSEIWRDRARRGREYVIRHRTWKAAMTTTLQHLQSVLAERNR